MKKYFCLAIFILVSLVSFSQTCPEIQFTYDASGNRIQRQLAIVSCSNNDNNNSHKSRRNPQDTLQDSTPSISANVYPNPTRDKINVQITEAPNNTSGPTKVTLYDVYGKFILSETLPASNYIQLDVSNLAAGTYLLRITCGTTVNTYKVYKT